MTVLGKSSLDLLLSPKNLDFQPMHHLFSIRQKEISGFYRCHSTQSFCSKANISTVKQNSQTYLLNAILSNLHTISNQLYL